MMDAATRRSSSRAGERTRARSRSRSPARSRSAGVLLAPLASPEERVEMTRALYLGATTTTTTTTTTTAKGTSAPGQAASPAGAALSPPMASADRAQRLCKKAARPTRRRNETLAADLERRIDQLLRQAQRWSANAANEAAALASASASASSSTLASPHGATPGSSGLDVGFGATTKKRRPRPPFDYAGAVLKLAHDFDSRVQEPTVHRFLSSLLAIIRSKPLGKRDIAHLRSDLVILGVQAPRAEIFAGLQQLHKDAMANKASEAAHALRMLASLVLKSTLVASATKVQAAARGHLHRARIARQKRHEEETLAASRVQAAARGKLVRETNKKRLAASTKMQSLARGYSVRRAQAKHQGAARKVQAVARGHHDRKVLTKKHAAATRVQAIARSRHEREALRKKKQTAVKAQAVVRGKLARVEFAAKRQGAIQVQAAVRGHQARKERKAKADAATKVQAVARGRIERTREIRRARSAMQIQAVTRGHLARSAQSVRELVASAPCAEDLADQLDDVLADFASDANAAICVESEAEDPDAGPSPGTSVEKFPVIRGEVEDVDRSADAARGSIDEEATTGKHEASVPVTSSNEDEAAALREPRQDGNGATSGAAEAEQARPELVAEPENEDELAKP